MTPTSFPPGTFSWVDLSSADMDASAAFYGELFGWTREDGDTGGGPPYAMFLHGGVPVAGLGALSEAMKAEGVPPVWNNYITVASVDATIATATEHGGTVVVPAMDVMDAGRMAFLADSSGAVFGLWQPGAHHGAGRVNEPVSLCWNELATDDLDGAVAFYTAVFGWGVRVEEGPTRMASVFVDGRENGHILQMTEAWEGMAPHWSPWFAVADCDATAADAVRLGGTMAFPPVDAPFGRFTVIVDPHGTPSYVIKVAEGPSEAD